METSRTVKEDAEKFSSQILRQVVFNINRYYRDYESAFNLTGGSAEFYRWIRADPGDRNTLNRSIKQIENLFLGPYLQYHPEVQSVVFYNDNGTQAVFRGVRPIGSLRLDYALEDDVELAEYDLGRDIGWSIRKSQAYVNERNELLPMTIMKFVKKYKVAQHTAYIAMDVSMEPIETVLNGIELGSRGKGLIVDENGLIVAHPNRELMFQKLRPELFNQLHGKKSGAIDIRTATPWLKGKQMLFFDELDGSRNWKVMISIPYEELERSVVEIRNVTFFIFIIGLAASIVGIVGISSSVTKRIKQLRKSMKLTDYGKFEHRVTISGKDEVSDLARVFNALLERLQHSAMELTESRILQHEAVLSALQSQINSHFLYNALESINSLANLDGNKEIEQMVVSLSKMLRYTSNYTETVVELKHEIEHLRHYLYIVGVAYGGMLEYSLEIEQSALRAPCLKAVLQPIVENSIKHGLETVDSVLIIRIAVKHTSDGNIRVVCSDNGGGFPPEKLEELLAGMRVNPGENQLKRMQRIGLLNVHFRLCMFFSSFEESGLTIANRSDGGAEVGFVLPARK